MLNAKFVRSHNVPVTSMVFEWFFRLFYEFWGFCVNGGNDLVSPGGFASSGSINFPATFTTTGTLSSGSDGSTIVGLPYFVTANPTAFSASYVNKWLVTWKSGSSSTDDSVYLITKWNTSSSIAVNVFNGGTPYSGNLHPSFTTRTDINYRVVDFNAVTNISTYSSTNDNFVLQFNGAPLVNSGQVIPQAKVRKIRDGSGYMYPAITLSPSGSWSGTSFSDPTTEVVSPNAWCHAGYGGEGPAYISMFAAQDFFICHYRGTNAGWDSTHGGFHIEIPQRLYPQNNDPNPIIFAMFGGHYPQDDSTYGVNQATFCNSFYMHHPPDNTTRKFTTLTRSAHGACFFERLGYGFGAGQLQQMSDGRYNRAFFHQYLNKFLISDGVLALPDIPKQFCMARVRLRRVRFIAPIIPQWQRMGNSGEWLHIVYGVLWPWDNSVLPYNLFLGGN